MKLCFIDVETTGTDPVKNGIIQLSGQLVIDSKEHEPFDFKVAPILTDLIDDKALKISGITRDDLKSEEFKTPKYVKGAFLDILGEQVDKYQRTSKFFFVGYFANFDYQFMREWFLKQGDIYFGAWFWHPPIDVAVLAIAALGDRRMKMPNFKLATVAKEFGIEVDADRLHDAAYDIELTRRIYDLIAFVPIPG